MPQFLAAFSGKSFTMKYSFRLYITGNTLASQHAVSNLGLLCKNELCGLCDVEIIDILKNAELAEEEKILATPTLVKSLPLPIRKVIGDLSHRSSVLFGLGLEAHLPKGDKKTTTQEWGSHDDRDTSAQDNGFRTQISTSGKIYGNYRN